MNLLLRILKDQYDYDSFQAVLVSLMPSVKYQITLATAVASSGLAVLYDLIGLSQPVFLGFVAIMILELLTGTFNALFVKKEKFSGVRLFRFLFKMAIYMVLISATYNMSKSEMSLVATIFTWLTQFVTIQITIENFYSVLENIAKMYGRENHAWVSLIKEKIHDLLFKTPVDDHRRHRKNL